MKNITKESLEKDLAIVTELFEKFTGAIWEGQEGQPAHWDNQLKLVKIAMVDVRTALATAKHGLEVLVDIKDDIKEDEKKEQ